MIALRTLFKIGNVHNFLKRKLPESLFDQNLAHWEWGEGSEEGETLIVIQSLDSTNF